VQVDAVAVGADAVDAVAVVEAEAQMSTQTQSTGVRLKLATMKNALCAKMRYVNLPLHHVVTFAFAAHARFPYAVRRFLHVLYVAHRL